MAAAEGGGSDVDWSGDDDEQDWTLFGLKEDPNKERKIGPADMENLTKSLSEFKGPQDQPATSALFKKVDDETSKRIRTCLEANVQAIPDLAVYGQYQHLDVGHTDPRDSDLPPDEQRWIRHQPGSAMSNQEANEINLADIKQRVADGEMSEKKAAKEMVILEHFKVFNQCRTSSSGPKELLTSLLTCCMKCKKMVPGHEAIPQLASLDPKLPGLPVHLKDKNALIQPNFSIPEGYMMFQICINCFSESQDNKDDDGVACVVTASSFRASRDLARRKIFNFGVHLEGSITSENKRGFAWKILKENAKEMQNPKEFLTEGRTPGLFEELVGGMEKEKVEKIKESKKTKQTSEMKNVAEDTTEDMEVDKEMIVIEETVVKVKKVRPPRGLTYNMVMKLMSYMEDHPEADIGIPSIQAAAAMVRQAALAIKESFWPALYGACDYLSVIFTSTNPDGSRGPTLIVKYA